MMMDRNREARRSANMLASSNGLARRRHRTNSLRDSPDEDGAVELQESVRLRERVKKDRDRDRERSLNRSSKRRRGEKMMIHGSNRDDGGEDTSEESVNDEEDDGGGGGGDNHNHHHNNHHHHHNKNGSVIGGGGVRLIPSISNSAASSAAISTISNHFHNGNSNNNHHHSSNYSNSNTNHVHVRKNFPPSVPKVIPPPSAAVTSSVLKYGDEMIGVSVPRKARSASTKRSHDWMSSNAAAGGVVMGGGGGEHVNRQTSISPARPSLVSPSTALLPTPLSPSSSNVSAKKKIKASGSKQPKPPKSSSKTSSVNPEELEIEIAEVLFGLKSQSQAPPKKVSNDLVEINRSSSDAKSRVSSPLSNSPTTNVQSSTAVLPLNSSSSAGSLTAVAPKRKKPRQVSENPGSFSVRNGPIPSMKSETDQTTPKAEVISPSLDKNPGSAVENGHKTVNPDGLLPEQKLPQPMKKDLESKLVAEGLGESPDVISRKEVVSSPKKESPAEITEEIGGEDMKVTATVFSSLTKGNSALPDAGTQREEKAQIDLEASPQQMRTSTERGDVNMVAACEQNAVVYDVDAVTKPMDVKDKEDENSLNLGKVDASEADGEDKKVRAVVDEPEVLKQVENKLKNVDVEKPEIDNGVVSKLPQPSQRQNQLPPPKSAKEEPQNERTGQSNTALPLAMSVASWPGGLPPMGYIAPMQGVVTMDGNTISPTPIQPVFSLPRPKRCATHCYIARNIHCLQQFMKMNPIWQAAAGSASLFGSKPANISIVPQADLSGSIGARAGNNAPDKAPGLTILPGHGGKDRSSQPSPVSDSGQRKQQILLQQTLPHVAPNSMMAPAFIFPLNQQQATVAAASARPGLVKQPASTSGSLPSSSTHNASATSASATAGGAVSFSYPNMPAYDTTQYLAILQNSYPFPIPAVGAPPNYRGTHPQPLPLFNGSFYSSQIIHPSQFQQSQQPISQSLQMQQGHQSSMPGNSSSSQKHVQSQQQQRPAGTVVASGNNAGGNLQNFPAVKNRQMAQSQQAHNQHMTASARQVENEVAVEDSASTADSRGSRASQNIYAQNFAVPMHPQNYALVATAPPALASNSAASSGSNQNEKKQQQPQQQHVVKTAMESLPQNFAMPFDFSLARQNAVFQSLPEAKRHNIQNNIQKNIQNNIQMMSQHRKSLRISDDGRTGGTDSCTIDDESKVMTGKSPSTAGQSIAFSRSEFADASVSAALANNQADGSSRSLNLASGGPSWTARSAMPSNMGAAASISNAQSQVQQQQQQLQQQQQQQMMQLRKQYQQLAASTARSKNNLTSNVSVFPEHLSSTMTSAAGMFPDGLSGVPQSLVQTSHSSSQTQSPQWRSSARTSAAQSPSSFVSSSSSLKNQQQQQQGRTPQVQTQISFGTNQKPAAAPQGQPLPSSSQSPSSPMMVGSPSTSSMSKGGGGSPRTASVSAQHPKNSSVPPGQTVSAAQISSLSTQHAKSSPVGGRNVPSILGNPHISSTSSNVTKYPIELQPHQMQQLRKNLQQAQIFFSSNPSLSQFQNPPFATNSNPAGGGGYYMQRWRPDQQQQLGMSSASSSSGLLASCPVSLNSGGTTDPAKAIAAATAAASNMKGSNLPPSHGILNAAQFASQSAASSYVHNVPAAAVQIKPTEQKQQAGNDNLHASWQPEKK